MDADATEELAFLVQHGLIYEGLIHHGLSERKADGCRPRSEAGDVPTIAQPFRDGTSRMVSGIAAAVAGHADRAKRLRSLQRQLVDARDDERRAIASTLHDTTLQLLTAAGLGTDRARIASDDNKDLAAILADVREQISEAQRQIADLTYMIYPQRPGRLGLSDTLQEVCAGFARRTSLSIILAPSENWDRQPPEIATTIIRVVQEALTNVHKHTDATTVWVSLLQGTNGSQLTIADDAKGFDSDRAQGMTGIGLLSCRDRAEAIGGTLEIITTPSGATIVVNLP